MTDRELKVRGRPIFFPTLHVRKTGKCHRGAWKAGWQFPDVTRQENRKRRNGERKRRKACRKCHRGAGIVLFQIVLGLMCPGGLCRGGKSQNEAKSRRFGMDLPSRAFYEGVNPKTILNNCRRRLASNGCKRRSASDGGKRRAASDGGKDSPPATAPRPTTPHQKRHTRNAPTGNARPGTKRRRHTRNAPPVSYCSSVTSSKSRRRCSRLARVTLTRTASPSL